MTKQEEMEHSIVVYLLDAIRCSPRSAHAMIDMVMRDLKTEKFLSKVERLKKAQDIVEEEARIRQEML